MKHFFTLGVLLSISLITLAQEDILSDRAQRSSEDIARKQTIMLIRKLAIVDSFLSDTLYKLNLKYLCIQAKTKTKEQEAECLQNLTIELRQLLSPEQFSRLINLPLCEPRYLHAAYLVPSVDTAKSISKEQ